MAFAWSRYESLRDLGLLPAKIAVAGIKHVVHALERDVQSPEEQLTEKYEAFEAFMASNDGEYRYQADFDTHTKQGATMFQAFTEMVKEIHEIEITEPDETDLAQIPMLNGHRLEIHRQNSGGYFLMGHIEAPNNN